MTEKPVECSQCKKPTAVTYKEIIGEVITCSEMCAGCPLLEEKLYGDSLKTHVSQKEKSLCCGNCGTSLESIKMGNLLGCSECYAVFGDVLIAELCDSGSLPSSIKKKLGSKRMQPLHIGKCPGKSTDIVLSSKLASLNEALNEALKRENYEQAAWLRDQINALTGNRDGSKS